MIVKQSKFPQKFRVLQSHNQFSDETQKTNTILNHQQIYSPTKKGTLSSLVQSLSLDFFHEISFLPPDVKNDQKLIKTPLPKTQSDIEKVNDIQMSNFVENIHSSQVMSSQIPNVRNQNPSEKGTRFFEDEYKLLQYKCQKIDTKSQLNLETPRKPQPLYVVAKGINLSLHAENYISALSPLKHLQKQNKIFNFDPKTQSTKFSNSDNQNSMVGEQKSSSLQIQDFQEIKMLGQGCYGKVSLAKHKKTNMLVAIKRIFKSSLRKKDLTYLVRQIKIQSFSDHPNIAKIYAFFEDSQNIYLILEPCIQGTLLELMHASGGKISEEKTKKYIKQVCNAVNFLHSHQIIHRDLKPQNILVQNGVAKICDFGWAVQAPQLRSTLCGTPLYTSPELAKRESYHLKLDIWNIGVMTYELICGKVPFEIQCHDDLQKVVLQEATYPENGVMSEECINFIKGCLQKNPKDRYQSWELLRHPFINIKQQMRETIAGMWGQERRY